MYFRVAIIFAVLSLSACSSWVYRYDVPQGNYLEKKGIEKLQVGMTKEQVKFILGSHVVVDPFDDDTWSYVYRLKSGRGNDFNKQKQLIIKFSNDLLVSAEGDYPLSDNFNTPFNESPTDTQELSTETDTSKVIRMSDEPAPEGNIEAEKAAEESLKEAEIEAEEAI